MKSPIRTAYIGSRYTGCMIMNLNALIMSTNKILHSMHIALRVIISCTG